MIAALLVTALVPLVMAIVLANVAVRRVSDAAFQPAFRAQLERSLALYRDLAGSMRRAMESEATAIAASPELSRIAASDRKDDLQHVVERVREAHPSLVTLALLDANGAPLATSSRPAPVDERSELPFRAKRQLSAAAGAPSLELTFAADRRRFDDATAAREFAVAYEGLEHAYEDATRDRGFAVAFAALLGATLVLAVGVGARVVRPITRRIDALLAATRPVADGDLSVRVAEDGDGELLELAQSFNRMLEQLEKSRARIEFLKRIGQWQTVARRLAHEIKNPLTPIQLAVEECCQRYKGDDENYRSLLRTTRDIVVEEVASLRTLVSEFAAFARLPRAHLRPGDLGEMLREHWPRLERDELPDAVGRPVKLHLEVVSEPLLVAFDGTMMHRVLVNLMANATQATAEASPEGEGHVWVRAGRSGEFCEVVVEDDGPGIADVLKAAVFDPYVTTRKSGTGLGLSIVQKIVIDHGGTVELADRPSGGARFSLRLPLVGTDASDTAMSKSHSGAWGGTGSHPGVV